MTRHGGMSPAHLAECAWSLSLMGVRPDEEWMAELLTQAREGEVKHDGGLEEGFSSEGRQFLASICVHRCF